jgi:hypothetical protein
MTVDYKFHDAARIDELEELKANARKNVDSLVAWLEAQKPGMSDDMKKVLSDQIAVTEDIYTDISYSINREIDFIRE